MTISSIGSAALLFPTAPVNNGEATTNIRGFDINTSGNAKIDPKYREILEQRKLMMEQGGAALQPLVMPSQDFARLMEHNNSSQYVTAPISATAIAFGDTATPELESISGPGGWISGEAFTSGDPAAITHFYRGQLTELMELMKVEDQLQKQFGDDVKIAYDKRADNYVMLRPGDTGYEHTKSGDHALADTLDFFRMDFADMRDYRDIFQRYGITV